jgi:hypothetical protein
LIKCAYSIQTHAFVHRELVEMHPKKSEHVSPGAFSQLFVQHVVASVFAADQQVLNPEGLTQLVESKVNVAQIAGTRMNMQETTNICFPEKNW